MPKFEEKYLHCMWSDELEGKKVFYADLISMLIKEVADGDNMGFVKKSRWLDLPFSVNGDSWSFVYYDPYFHFKVAREQGKVIQRYWKSEQEWEEYIGDDFPDDISLYRIKPEETKPITNRELAMWLAKGNGQRTTYGDNFSCDYAYSNGQDDEEILSNVVD